MQIHGICRNSIFFVLTKQIKSASVLAMKKLTVAVSNATYSQLLEIQKNMKEMGIRRAPLGAAVDFCAKTVAQTKAAIAIPGAKPVEPVYEVPPITAQNTTTGAATKAEGAQ
jgi:hypothetical protein